MDCTAYIFPFAKPSERLAAAAGLIAREPNAHVVLIHDPPADPSGPQPADAPVTVVQSSGGARTTLLSGTRHHGYTSSVNAAVAWLCRNVAFDTVWIVNDDVILVRGVPQTPAPPEDAGLIGVLSNKAGYQSIAYSLDDIGDYLYPEADPAAAAERYDDVLARRPPHFVPVPLVHGFCFAVFRRRLEAVGLLDARSYGFGYGSDFDLSLRMIEAGYRNYVYTGTFIAHESAGTAGRAARRIRAIRADHQLRKTYGERYARAKFVTRQRLNRHLSNYTAMSRG